MKKLAILALVLILAVSATSCKPKTANAVNNVEEASKAIQQEEQMPNKPEENKEESKIEGPLKLAYEGKMEGVEVAVGSELADVIEAYGEPLELAPFEGSSYLSYQNISFILDRVVDTTKEKAVVMGIVVSEDYEMYGVKVGMTPAEIKQILGAANNEYMEGEEEYAIWKMEYQCGDYLLTFFFNDKESPSNSAYLSMVNSEDEN